MIVCPSCGGVELRVHAALQHIVWGRRFWAWDPIVPIGNTVAVEVSCGDCMFAFSARPDGSFTQAPLQAAHDALARSMKQLKSDAKDQKSEQDARKPRPQVRPAPDPRGRR